MFDLTPILVLLIIFGAVVAIVYLGIRRKERMAMMEKGVDASIFLAPKSKNAQTLKFGLLLIGLALGILMGNVVSAMESFMYEKEAAYFSMIFLFGGLSLVIYHFMAKKIAKDEDNDSLMKKD